MDFIARSGSMISNAYRLSGVLFILVVVLSVMVVTMFQGNARRDAEFERMRNELKVYVVPGAQAGVYAPSRQDLLLEQFVNHVTQSFLTYTPANLERQYETIRQFLTPNMLSHSQRHFDRLVRNAQADARSSMFVPDRGTLRWEDLEVSYANTKQKKVSIEGIVHLIVGSTPVEEIPTRIEMTLNQTYVSRTNPFGYVLAKYKEIPLKN